MEQFTPDKIRNVVLLSHSGAGKTSLSEILLFSAGAIPRLGKVDEGNTTSDYDPDEVKRRISINLSVLPFTWKGNKINMLDTPGYSDFVGEVKSAMRVCEGAIILIDATSGIEVGTEEVWSYCKEPQMPRFIFVNKMDRENADFSRVTESLQSKFGQQCIPLQLPIGAHNDFTGIIDLLTLKAYSGNPPKETEVPAQLKPQVDSARLKLVEAIAGIDEKLIEKYLGDEPLTQEELDAGLKTGVKTGKIVPILTGSALKSIGIQALSDAIVTYLPSPKECLVEAIDKQGTQKITPSANGPLAALVFKTSADPYVGKLTYFRVFQGTISSNSQVWNSGKSEQERIGQLYLARGKNQEPVQSISTGDIGVVTKLNFTGTGDTLTIKEKPVKLPPIIFPTPIYAGAVTPKTKADLDKLSSSIARTLEEDPTLRVRREADTYETILSGMGETQLEVVVERMQRKFGVGVKLDVPKVPYKETVTASADGDFRHKKQTGGHGQFGHVTLEVSPLPRGSGIEFVDAVVGGAIPRNYIPAVEKGVNEAVQSGILAGFPVVDIQAKVYDGSFHPVDSSDICFKIAGAGAVKKAMADARPILLEPIVKLKVTVPESYTGDIMSDLNNKRGRVGGITPQDGSNVIEAEVPQAEILRYAIDLKSLTQGRGRYTYEFSHYEEVPTFVAQKIISEREKEREAARAEKE